MRADRLVALLMLLQTRKRVTAAEVAAELEVSERTARRDLEALGMAGVPVYPRPGRNGGWELVGGARTDLSGLTAPEARALFLVAGTAHATPQLKAALRKLVRALPEPFRDDAAAASNAVIVDRNGWGGRRPARPVPPHLDALQHAVVAGEQVELEYVARDRKQTTRVVHPLGLAAKDDVWYLVANTEAGLRTFRVDRVSSLRTTGEPATRPDGFDLAQAWEMISAQVDELRAPVRARAIVVPEVLAPLRWLLDTRLRVGPARADGRVDIEFSGHSEESIARLVAGFGAAVTVEEPEGVRLRLAEIASELATTYLPARARQRTVDRVR